MLVRRTKLCLSFFALLFLLSDGQAQPSTPDPIALFTELSTIYRPAKGEEDIIAFLKTKFEEAKIKWPQPNKLTWEQDGYGAGNILIHIPGTRNASATEHTVALQAHLDMVLDVKGLLPGEEKDIQKYFVNGVNLKKTEENDEWIHSKGFKNSIGADNGIGVALALRYLMNPDLEHPPLELIFTVQEEIGMLGAKNFGLQSQADFLVNIDTEHSGVIYHGCLGSNRRSVIENVKMEKLAAEKKGLIVQMTNLKGGHSGGDIHRNRLNSAKAVAYTMEELEKVFGEQYRFVEVEAGDKNVLNKIPTSFRLVVIFDDFTSDNTLDAGKVNHLKDAIIDRVRAFADESPEVVSVEISEVRLEQGALVLSREHSKALLQSILNIPNGPVLPPPETALESNLGTTSNLGFLRLDANNSQVEFAFMARSLDESELNTIVTEISKIADELSGPAAITIDIGKSPPWFIGSSNLFVQKAVQSFDGKFASPVKTGIAAGGIEPAWFSRKYPKMQLISIGPDIRDSHSASEKMNIDSVYRLTNALDHFLRSF